MKIILIALGILTLIFLVTLTVVGITAELELQEYDKMEEE